MDFRLLRPLAARCAVIEIRVINDISLVEKTLKEPHIYEAGKDDLCPKSEDFHVPVGLSFINAGAYDGEEYLGLFLIEPRCGAVVQIHTCLLKSAWNGRTDECAQAVIDWVWKNTSANRLVTEVPSFNERAKNYAERHGFSVYGVNESAWVKDGIYHDVLLLGLTRPLEK